MGKRVVLDFDEIPNHGLRVSLEIGNEKEPTEIRVVQELPLNPALLHSLEDWQTIYCALDLPSRIKPKQIYTGSIHRRLDHCRAAATQVSDGLTAWLRSESFSLINERLREVLSLDDEIRVLIRTNRPELQKLPWHQWNFFENYRYAEYALSQPNAERVRSQPSQSEKDAVQVLVILGDSTGIDIESDRQQFEQLRESGAAVTFLPEPTRAKLNASLWQQPWDILCFSGHSKTQGQTGRMFINQTESITVEEVRYGLRQAIARGLQLAIFNSCDGLGLAYDLAELHIPQMIVMRAPVPDSVAQMFLRSFLTEYAQGRSLYLAERAAREQLQALEHQFPCASWLPVIFQNAATMPPTWSDLQGHTGGRMAGQIWDVQPPPVAKPREQSRLTWAAVRRVVVASIIVTSLVVGVRSLGALQPAELHAYDRLMQLRPAEPPDDRILIVTIDEDDRQYQLDRNWTLQGSLADEAWIGLIQTIQPYQPNVLGIGLLRDQVNHPDLIDALESLDDWIAICTISSYDTPSEAFLPGVVINSMNLGFSNLIVDDDIKNTVRRYVISQEGEPKCDTNVSFGALIANLYLSKYEGSDHNGRPVEELKLSYMDYDSGGYQLSRDNQGRQQILLNYRSSNPPTISLRRLLNGSLEEKLSDLVSNRIVLISSGVGEYKFFTPFHDGMKSPLTIQAHAISQLISAAIDKRPLIRWWSVWLETIWIWIWAVIGGLLVLVVRSPQSLIVIFSLVQLALFSCCYMLFCLGWWVPLIPASLVLGATSLHIVLGHSREMTSH